MGDEYHADVGVHSSRDEREKLIDAFAGEFCCWPTGFGDAGWRTTTMTSVPA